MLSLWSNSPKELTESIYYTFDDHFGRATPSYQPREVIYDYIITRAKLADIRKYIRFQTIVRFVDLEGQQFKMTVENLNSNIIETLTFDHVIVAAGRYSTPEIPEFNGMSSFPGRILHSKYFRDAGEFINEHVLIIGSGPSAEDIALQLYKFGARFVTISYRTEPMGYKWPDKKIVEVPLLVRMEGRIAHFLDSTTSREEIDSIILCTGYRYYYPFMAKNLRLECPPKVLYPPNLYKGIFWIDQPNLIYLGMQKLLFAFTMFDVQALFVRNVILGGIVLPDLKTRQHDIEQWQAREAAVKPDGGLGNFHFRIDYMLDLLKQCYSTPPFDINRIIAGEREVGEHKQDNILTYRDYCFPSALTGKRFLPTPNRLSWLKNMDDSLEGFLRTEAMAEDLV